MFHSKKRENSQIGRYKQNEQPLPLPTLSLSPAPSTSSSSLLSKLNWLQPWLSVALSGSLWLCLVLSGSLWLCLALSGSIALRDCLKVLVWLMIASLQHLSSALSNILDKWDLWNILTKITPGPFGILCKRRQSYAREGHCIKRRGLFKICI